MRQRLVTALACAALALAVPAWGEGERAGDFDYYVLALSWSPTWCTLEGDARQSPQCERPLGWVLHGLWPQYEDGWPSYCRTTVRDPSRSQTRAMADIMGDGGAAWYQWKKHGRCSGLEASAYFETARAAYESIVRPQVFRDLKRDVKLPASVIEEAFLEENSDLSPRGITVTCKDRRIQEVRICVTRDLEPRACGYDVQRDCTLDDALFEAIE